MPDWLFIRLGFWLRDFFARQGFELAADDVGGKAGAEEAAVHRGDFVFGNLAAEGAEFAFEALADDGGFVGIFGGLGEGGFDVAVGDAAGAEVAGDAEFALAADLGALAGELFGVAVVVEAAVFLQAGQDYLGEEVAAGSAFEEFLHFVYGMRAAHQGAEGYVVEFGFGVEFFGAGEHRGEA